MDKVLIIEDEVAIASMYEFKLTKSGYSVEVAHDGRRGLELAQSFAPNLILLDLRLPFMNGDEVLEKIRATDWGSKVRVMVLTNISKDEAPSRLRLLRVDRYIVKAHHTPSQVVNIVEDVLGKTVTNK